jgi:hypothetical protein
MLWRNDNTIPENAFTDASVYYASMRKGMREKANHNKREAQACFVGVIACTLIAPLFVTLSNDFYFGKLLPSALSVLAAGLTSWVQLRRPQKLWVIYRRAQRELEQAKADYDFKDGEFATEAMPDKLLARKVTAIGRWVHDQWEGLVPEPEALLTTSSKTQSEKGGEVGAA